MPTTELPSNVNTYNTQLRSILDARFGLADAVINTTVQDPGSPSQYVVEAVTVFQAQLDNIELTYAPLESPVFVGTPQAPNPANTSNDTTLATTFFVRTAVDQYLTTGTPLYVDTANGRLGINNTTPTSALHVTGTTLLVGNTTVQGNVSITGVTGITGNTTITGMANITGNTTISGFANIASTLQAGNTTISGWANVSGNGQIMSLGVGTAASGTTGEIRATHNVTAYYSDDRLKTRLGNIENALDKIDQLNGFYYEANELAQNLGYEKVQEVGVSAQDTQKIMPEIVADAPIDSRYLTVRYERFAPLLIEGIKELRVEINNIKKHLGI